MTDSKVSEAYVVAEHLHDTFFGNNDLLSPAQLAMSGVRATIGSSSSSTSQRIETEGVVNGRPAKQTLAKDRRGVFHLSTTFYQGELVQADIRPSSDPGRTDTIVDSLFMRRLAQVFLKQ